MTVLSTPGTSVTYKKIDEPHSISVLQDFSAPVTLETDFSTDDLLRLMGADPNPFNRWEAGQTLARQLMGDMAKSIESGEIPAPNSALRGYCEAMKRTLNNSEFDNAFKDLALTLPSQMEVLQSLNETDPIAVQEAGKWLSRALADHLRDDLVERYHALAEYRGVQSRFPVRRTARAAQSLPGVARLAAGSFGGQSGAESIL